MPAPQVGSDQFWVLIPPAYAPFDAELLNQALNGSFAARGTPVQDIPLILSEDFATDAGLERQWTQYLRRARFIAPEFSTLMSTLMAFYGPVLLEHLRAGRWNPEHLRWE